MRIKIMCIEQKKLVEADEANNQLGILYVANFGALTKDRKDTICSLTIKSRTPLHYKAQKTYIIDVHEDSGLVMPGSEANA